MSNLCAYLLLCWITIISATHYGINLEAAFGIKNMNPEILDKMFGEQQALKLRIQAESQVIKLGRIIRPNDRIADLSLDRNRKTDALIHKMEKAYLPFEEVSYELFKRFDLSADAINNDLPRVQINGVLGNLVRQICMNFIESAHCDPNLKYRRMDGQCNNLWNPRWGSAQTCQQRLLPANYVGVSGFRVSVNGEPLPPPRQLSLNVHSHLNKPTNYVNHMYMYFGQLLAHDITQTPQTTIVTNQALQCCPPTTETHPQCAPIIVPPDDPFYSRFNVTCLNFVRSVACPTCTLGPRQIMNQVTSFIDASFVYGNSELDSRFLRRNDGTGKLRIQSSKFGDLLPPSADPLTDQCSSPATNEICFLAGDSRVNQNTVLTSLHTIFLREHNRIASELKLINQGWGEEKLFQEARRILGAQMQAIVYNEYLPITLNDDRMTYFKLWSGERTTYDQNENPTTLLEFTAALFRFGHTLINSIVTNKPLNYSNGPRYLRNDFFQPFPLYEGLAEPLVEGVSNSPAEWFDGYLVPDITNYLERLRGNPTGLDLASVDIYRGRDHGLPTYVDTLQYCLQDDIVIKNFNDLVKYDFMTQEQSNILQKNYRFVQDIDLWTGILSEKYNEGSVVGPTAACIIGLQFQKLKFGDRFYYEHLNEAGSFTFQQVRALQEATLSQIICLNTEIESMPKNAMLFSSKSNPIIQCKQQKGIDLWYWNE